MRSGTAKKLAFTALAAVVLAALAAGGYALHAKRIAALQRVAPPTQYPWALRTAKVVRRDLTSGFPVLATLSSRTENVIFPQISGVILKLGPREGQAVKRGELLVKIDTRELANQLAALKASLQSAKDEEAFQRKELRREETLLRRGYATQEDVDRLQTAVRTARQAVNRIQGEIDALRTKIAYGTIVSPTDGVIAARLQEPGDLASPGRPIYRITALGGAKVAITVPQNVAARLHVGSEIVLRYGEARQTVAITRVFPALDALSMGRAEADLDRIPFGLPSGARVPGRVILDKKLGALVVPVSAVAFAPSGDSGVLFKVVSKGDGAVPVLRKVAAKIVGRGREGVAVKGAVAAGDQVVVAQENTLLKLKDGDAVLPAPEARP